MGRFLVGEVIGCTSLDLLGAFLNMDVLLGEPTQDVFIGLSITASLLLASGMSTTP